MMDIMMNEGLFYRVVRYLFIPLSSASILWSTSSKITDDVDDLKDLVTEAAFTVANICDFGMHRHVRHLVESCGVLEGILSVLTTFLSNTNEEEQNNKLVCLTSVMEALEIIFEVAEDIHHENDSDDGDDQDEEEEEESSFINVYADHFFSQLEGGNVLNELCDYPNNDVANLAAYLLEWDTTENDDEEEETF